MIAVRWVSRNLPSPERHPHDGVIDSHDQQRQQVDQNDNYDMIPWKEHRESNKSIIRNKSERFGIARKAYLQVLYVKHENVGF